MGERQILIYDAQGSSDAIEPELLLWHEVFVQLAAHQSVLLNSSIARRMTSAALEGFDSTTA